MVEPSIVFGKQDSISLPQLAPTLGHLSTHVFYTHPTLETCYSPYGFAYPLSSHSIPLHTLLDHKFLTLSSKFEKTAQLYSYFYIDFSGLCWKLVLLVDSDYSHTLTQYYIDTSTPGWWITQDPEGRFSADLQKLLGYLYTDPNQTEIVDYCFKYHQAETRVWMSISDILRDLHERQDKEKLKEKYSVIEKT